MQNHLCPCGSQQELDHCCQAIITGAKQANTAEQLMRSRFTAYALGDSKYVANTYAAAKQAENSEADIKAWMDETVWLSLNVEQTDYTDNTYHYVQFVVRYLHGEQLCEMRENSRFLQENGSWRYLDGDIINHDVVKTIGRNEPCPCLSGKKFKRCHG
ncbi:hypothetical protein E2K93_00900 [Thalassotalea sp. HSM 43]|uniref:YchJ family protein n=1 Tax=Thalassotalea sp. HSM 43 TaxID=2552945 RepID=UPI0010816B33|nr:YchJ family protein [Thalassotalea sp. HSM 43]QBY03015.1 hypothetical protein E2K93_00900 [Thalassotalea sp. HSM 43]